MRKAIIAAIVATALFAVGAFAANFVVSSEDVASGANNVSACAPHVDVDFATPTANASTGVWNVGQATVRFYAAAASAVGNTTGTCDGFAVRIAVGMGDTPTSPLTYAEYAANTTVASGATTVALPALDVARIHAVSVVVDGKTLTADLTAPA